MLSHTHLTIELATPMASMHMACIAIHSAQPVIQHPQSMVYSQAVKPKGMFVLLHEAKAVLHVQSSNSNLGYSVHSTNDIFVCTWVDLNHILGLTKYPLFLCSESRFHCKHSCWENTRTQ